MLVKRTGAVEILPFLDVKNKAHKAFFFIKKIERKERRKWEKKNLF